MSIQSKARRDARLRKAKKAANAPTAVSAPVPAIEPHADLRDATGSLLGGIVRRDGEWTLGLGGRIAGYSDSPARVLVLLQRARDHYLQAGQDVRLNVSTALATAVRVDIEARGMTFDAFKAALEAELAAGAPAAEDGDAVH